MNVKNANPEIQGRTSRSRLGKTTNIQKHKARNHDCWRFWAPFWRPKVIPNGDLLGKVENMNKTYDKESVFGTSDGVHNRVNKNDKTHIENSKNRDANKGRRKVVRNGSSNVRGKFLEVSGGLGE